jgi:hypothetical protein
MTVDGEPMTPLTAGVRRVMASLLMCALLSACAAPPRGGTLSGATDRTSPRSTVPKPASVDSKQEAPEKSGVRMDRRVYGRIASVNPTLRFVVMDFTVWRMPALDQRLHVYRNDQRIGEVKVTGPAVDTTIAGDLVAGEARPGDEVRE